MHPKKKNKKKNLPQSQNPLRHHLMKKKKTRRRKKKNKKNKRSLRRKGSLIGLGEQLITVYEAIHWGFGNEKIYFQAGRRNNSRAPCSRKSHGCIWFERVKYEYTSTIENRVFLIKSDWYHCTFQTIALNRKKCHAEMVPVRESLGV